MNRLNAPRRRSLRFWSAALSAALLTALLPGVGALAAPKPPVVDSQVSSAASRLNQVRARVEQVSTALDQTAAQYEQANAHRIRIADELAASDLVVQEARTAVAAAEETLGSRIAAVYKHPREDLAMTDALFKAPDAPTALHRAAIYRRLVSRSADEVQDVRWAAELTETDTRQAAVIAAGAEASTQEWRRQSVALAGELRSAQAEVATAVAELEKAHAEAERRAEEERRRAEEQRRQEALLQTGAAPTGAPPAVNGRVCPVGQPNGFIDSWGFPRSGGRTHEGADMFAPYGTPTFAVAGGVIYRVYNNPLGGLAINLIDDDGNMYYYAHMSSVAVKTGQKIGAGQVIGAVGTSGNAAGTPPHLHWQYHPGNGAPVNPYPLAFALCR